MTDGTVCAEKHKRIDEALELHNDRLNAHSTRLDALEKDYTGAVKDIGYLKEAITELKQSIDKLIAGLDNLRIKPLAKYEQIAMFVITAIVAYVLGKVL
jgi:archaellum component FlaC